MHDESDLMDEIKWKFNVFHISVIDALYLKKRVVRSIF